jgi:hypothetical protein
MKHPLPWKESDIKGVPYVQTDFDFEKFNIKKQKPRIIILGDYISIHRGNKWGQTNVSYPELLDDKLSHTFEIINTSAVFYSLPEEMAMLKNKAIYYNPDIIIIGYVFNDLYLKNSYHAIIPLALKNNICKLRIITPLALKYFEILNKNKYYSKAYEHAPGIVKFYADLYSNPKLINVLKDSLSELGQIKKEKKIEVIFVIMPIFYDFEDKNLNYINDIVSKECQKAGIDYINILEVFKTYKVMELKEDDGDVWHPNSLGREIIASEIYKRIVDKNN